MSHQLKFPSPCGVLVVKPALKTDGGGLAILGVSVPLRGFGSETTRDYNWSQYPIVTVSVPLRGFGSETCWELLYFYGV